MKSLLRLSRRRFLFASGASVAGVAVARESTAKRAAAPEPCVPASGQSLRVDDGTAPPPKNPLSTDLRFFTAREARTVDALLGRLVPGSPEDPGAREAGALFYIDKLLANEGGFAQPVYRQGPLAEPYRGAAPPEDTANGRVVFVEEVELPRYGYQSALTFRDVWRLGLRALDRHAKERFGEVFVALDDEQQDTILAELEEGRAPTFDEPSAQDFFTLARTHTIEGMFCDPIYGGNRDLVGWRLIDYPGAQRAYLPAQLVEGAERVPQSLADMERFHAGHRTGEAALLPVSGTCIPPTTWDTADDHFLGRKGSRRKDEP